MIHDLRISLVHMQQYLVNCQVSTPGAPLFFNVSNFMVNLIGKIFLV